jgi:hypothetical protein
VACAPQAGAGIVVDTALRRGVSGGGGDVDEGAPFATCMRVLRRTFLAHSLTGAVLAPLAPALLASRARAQAAPRAKNLVVFFAPNGTVHHRLRPRGTPQSFTVDDTSILAPLERARGAWRPFDDISFLDEVDLRCRAGNHEGGQAAMLTGDGVVGDVGGGASLDQFLGRTLFGDARFPSLVLGVQTSAWGAQQQTRVSYESPGVFAAVEDDPRAAFRRLFGDSAGGDVDTARRRRQSVIDLVKDRVDAAKVRVGRDEQQKLEQHLSALRTLEARLAPVDLGSCTAPAAPTALAPNDNDAFPDIAVVQRQLGVLALACGLSRVVVLQHSHTVSPTAFSWLGVPDQHHTLSHADDGNIAGLDAFVACEQWYLDRFIDVVDDLRTRPSPHGDGTLLDDTVVVYVKELGDSRLHDQVSVPFFVAGGGVRGGQWHQLAHQPHNRLLVSIAQQLGADVESYGSAGGAFTEVF